MHALLGSNSSDPTAPFTDQGQIGTPDQNYAIDVSFTPGPNRRGCDRKVSQARREPCFTITMERTILFGPVRTPQRRNQSSICKSRRLTLVRLCVSHARSVTGTSQRWILQLASWAIAQCYTPLTILMDPRKSGSGCVARIISFVQRIKLRLGILRHPMATL